HAGLHLDLATREDPRELRGHLLVLDGDDARQGLEQGDARAVGAVDVGELHAHRARPDDHEGAGPRLVPHGAVRGDHALLIDRDARKRAGLGAGGENEGAASRVVPPAAPVTSTVVALLTTPRPGTSVILFFLNRNSTPFAMRSATRRLRRIAS